MAVVLLLALILFLPSQGQKIKQAKIFTENTEVPEAAKLELTCSTFGLAKKAVYLYLCKDDKVIDMKYGITQDTIFKIDRTGMNHWGNYSCGFSEEQLEMTKVKGCGNNYIFIKVIESLIKTQIRLLESEVPRGSDVEIDCTTTSPVKNKSMKMILAFLIKNEMAIKVNIWDMDDTTTTFILRDVQMEDSGTYSCALLLNTLPYHGMRFDRCNKVHLQITAGSNTVVIVIMSTVIILLILFVGISVMIRKQGCMGPKNERMVTNETELSGNEECYEEIPEMGRTVPHAGLRTAVCTVSAWEEFSGSDELYNDLTIPQLNDQSVEPSIVYAKIKTSTPTESKNS